MEAQTISPFRSPPAPILVSIYRGARAPSLSLRLTPPPFFSSPISSVLSVVVSFWLTSSPASFLPFSVGSLEKLCALRGEHPFYTRAKRERGHTCERPASFSSSLSLFFPSPFPLYVSHTHPRTSVSAFTRRAKRCSPRPVIEDFGREWECHVDECN